MKHITFWVDFISPYAYLAFEQLPQALQGISHSVEYRPVLFAGLLKHHGQLGPAEIPAKREWTYRQVLWLARAQGVPMQMPAGHPFNPLALLRLAMACAPTDLPHAPSRYVCEAIFHHVWRGGLDAADPARLEALQQQLAPPIEPAGDIARARLKANGDAAIAAGLFGVPSFTVDGQVFWGLDSLPMLRAWLLGDEWFSTPAWTHAAQLPGVQRTRG